MVNTLRPIYTTAVLLLTATLLFGATALAKTPEPIKAQPAVGVTSEQVKPGLSVIYYEDKIRHISQMVGDRDFRKNGRPGPPLAKLDHDFGDGNVFDSGQPMLICLLIEGYIKLDKPGEYAFQAISNDGIRLLVDGKQVLEDPDVHAARLSPVGGVIADQAGLYALKIYYFQRKGTSALALKWKKPGDAEFSPVPASAYFHPAK